MSALKQPAFHLMLCLSALFLSACGASYDLSLRPDGSTDVKMQARLEPRTLTLLQNLSGFTGTGGASLNALDAAALNAALKQTPGVTSSALRNPDPKSLSGSFSIGDIARFLSSPITTETQIPRKALATSQFITWEPSPVKGSTAGRLAVSLDRATAPELVKALSPEITDYLSALMAPIVTSESLSVKEYLDAVSVMYGSGVSGEIANAKVSCTIELPGPVSSVKGGQFSGRKARFELSLVQLLVLEAPVRLEIIWK